MIKTRTSLPQCSKAAVQRISATCGIATPFLSVGVLLTVGYLHPGYSIVRQRISELGATGAPYAPLLNLLGLMTSGVLIVLLSLGIYLEVRNHNAAKVGCALLALSGVALLGAGIFPCDVGTQSPSTAGMLHAVCARTGELAMIGALLAMWLGLRGDPDWQRYSTYSLAAAVVVVALYLLYQLDQTAAWKGAIQRLLVMVVLVWIELMAIKLLYQDRRSGLKAAS
jgi:hypothetical membrane protein